MKCTSKYGDPNIFDYDIVDDDTIRIFRNDFHVNISRQMFDEMFKDFDG